MCFPGPIGESVILAAAGALPQTVQRSRAIAAPSASWRPLPLAISRSGMTTIFVQGGAQRRSSQNASSSPKVAAKYRSRDVLPSKLTAMI